ncbi:MAG: efflux RND transporter periplasmic adaptor subunit [Lachnospiraceae bacterium]|nr:efflux RND transporter periplasmic adaptor subunit [Lachnospiraceae bacterium]
MKKGIVALLVLALSAGGGGSAFYHFFYRTNMRPENGAQVDKSNVQYVNPVSQIAGLGNGSGLVIRYSGVVDPQETWQCKLENERTIEKTYVKEGDMVKRGQKLFAYKTDDDEQKMAEAQIALEKAQNDIEIQNKEIERLKKEAASKRMTEEEQLANSASILSAQNTIKQEEYEIKSKELEISNCKARIASATISSELEGIVKSINDGSSNSFSDSSSDAYITIMAVGKFRIKGKINEQNRNGISSGQDVLVFSRVDSGKYWTGKVTDVQLENGTTNNSDNSYGNSSDDTSNSSTYPFYVELDDSDDLILGQHVYIEPDYGQMSSANGIWIPLYYFVTEDDGDTWVWAESSDHTLEKRSVTLGETNEDLQTVEVTAGLKETDYIMFPSPDLQEGLGVVERSMEDDDYDYGDLVVSGNGSQGLEEDWEVNGYEEDDMFFEEDDDYDEGYIDDEDTGEIISGIG